MAGDAPRHPPRPCNEYDHKLAAYCATCERWAVLDLERLIAEGRRDYRFVGLPGAG
jgi:hypothetical protein